LLITAMTGCVSVLGQLHSWAWEQTNIMSFLVFIAAVSIIQNKWITAPTSALFSTLIRPTQYTRQHLSTVLNDTLTTAYHPHDKQSMWNQSISDMCRSTICNKCNIRYAPNVRLFG